MADSAPIKVYHPFGYLHVKYDKVLVDHKFELKFAKAGDIGLDLPVVMSEKLKILPHQDYYINLKEKWFDIPPIGVAEIPCGMSVKVPDDAWGNIKPRSSTGWKKRLVVFEGCIDSGYTGPLFVLVENPNSYTVRVHEFDKLAQLIIIPKYFAPGMSGRDQIKIVQADKLPETERGATGFGSSTEKTK
jgi:deoxyuridine 5'-triphosphate nucleotidohydrolase